MELSLNADFQLLATTAIVGSLLLLVVCLKYRKGDSKKHYRLPPGPRPQPILGNLALFGPLLHQDFKNLADKYGPIVYVRLGSVDVVAISSPALAEEVLKKKDHIFASRPRSLQGKLITYDHASVSFAPYGPYWRNIRKVYTVELITAKKIQQLQMDRKAAVVQGLRFTIDGCKDGQAIPIYTSLWKIVSSNISRMTFGKMLSGTSSRSWSEDESQHYENIIKDLQRVLLLFVPGDFIPFLRHVDFFGHKKQISNVAQQIDAFLEKIIQEHERKNVKSDAAANNEDNKDLVDVLLNWPALDHNTSLSRDTVKALLQEVLIAGTDTSTATLTWAFARLLQNPSTLKSAQEELDRVVGRDRLVEEKDLPRLPYVQAVVKETFRLHPPPLLVPHESSEATTLGDGYYIPKGCRVFVNVWAMGRDPSLWENPLEFNPRRFLNTGIEANGQNFKLLPFGSGRRSCPGRSIGTTMVEYSLAALLHACSWALPDGMSPGDLDMAEAPGLMVQKKIPLHVVASPRLPLSVIFSSQ